MYRTSVWVVMTTIPFWVLACGDKKENAKAESLAAEDAIVNYLTSANQEAGGKADFGLCIEQQGSIAVRAPATISDAELASGTCQRLKCELAPIEMKLDDYLKSLEVRHQSESSTSGASNGESTQASSTGSSSTEVKADAKPLIKEIKALANKKWFCQVEGELKVGGQGQVVVGEDKPEQSEDGQPQAPEPPVPSESNDPADGANGSVSGSASSSTEVSSEIGSGDKSGEIEAQQKTEGGILGRVGL